METALRRLDGVDKISISVSEQKFQVTLKPGAAFHPSDIRAAVGKAGVKVVRIRIAARGRVEEQGGKRYFVAGEDKFLVAAPAKILDGPVAIEGSIDDGATPWQLKILKSKPLPSRTAVKTNGG